MRLAIGLLAAAMCLAAGPATRPATQPASRPAKPDYLIWSEDRVAKAQAEVAAAEEAVAAAQASLAARLAADPTYQSLIAEMNAAKDALDAARASGESSRRMPAAEAFGRAKVAADKHRAGVISADDGEGRSRERLAAARKEMETAIEDHAILAQKAAMDAAEVAERRRLSDPMERAAEEKRLVVGMTMAQAKHAMRATAAQVIEESPGRLVLGWKQYTDSIYDYRGRRVSDGRVYFVYATFHGGKLTHVETTPH